MSETAKEKIVGVAQSLFAEKGYSSTSVREIANQADVNVASINYYFGSKLGLFEFLIEDFTNKKFSLVVSVLEPPETIEEFKLRLSLFIKQFLVLSQSDKNAFLMMNKNLDIFLQVSPEKFENTFLKIHNQFLNFVKSSQRKNIIRPEFRSEIVSQILFGGLMDTVRNQDLRRQLGVSIVEDSSEFDDYAEIFVDIFINGMGGAQFDS